MISFMPLTACFKFGHAGPYDMRSLSMYGDLWKRRRWKGFTSKKMPGTQMTLCRTQYSKKTTQLFSGGGKAETSAQMFDFV